MKKALQTTLIILSFAFGFSSTQARELTAASSKEVYIHYMGWYGAGQTGSHWTDGTTREPLVGYYNSQSWATHLYQILLAEASGIDGIVVNVRTEYDERTLKSIFPSLKRITDVDAAFDFKVAVSYDDQDMTQEAVETELTTLKNDIIATTSHYLHKNDEPVIFVWDYGGFLTSDNYRTAVTNVFTGSTPILLRNEIDFGATVGSINSYYPWVQGFAADGSNWGEGYINWYYNTSNDKVTADEIDFTTGAVWPGFDDRDVSWGQDRWIDRQDGATYESLWDVVHAKTVDWVIIETWNDWNEGTEVEPSKEHGFTYINKTATNIAEFKGTTSSLSNDLLTASTKVYQAAALLEAGDRNYDKYYPVLEAAIQAFINDDGAAAVVELDKIIDDTVPNEVEKVNDDTKRVYIHYLGWYGEGKDGNHWKDGTAQEPIIGYYDSQSWATHIYHILLSSIAGVDGMVVNVRTEFDEESLLKIIPSLQRIVDVKSDFDYKIAVSYDDQDMTKSQAQIELTTLRDDILPSTNNYLYKNDEPVVFIWNYDGFLTSDDYRDAVTTVFTEDAPILLRNEIDMEASVDAIDSYYPWVQGFDSEGTIWGEDYLDWYYRTLKIREDITFATGAVWPGFDDRKADWGQDRWIDRKEGETYQQTWDLALDASTDAEILLNWIIIETWNDWNEGTEIEPSKEHSFTYIKKTAENIATFKNTTIPMDDNLLAATTKIYQAAQLIESEARDYDEFYPMLEQAIEKLLAKDGLASIALSDEIITPTTVLGGVGESLANKISIYPNPAESATQISVQIASHQYLALRILDTNGKLIDELVMGHLGAGHHTIDWNAKGLKGMFILQVQSENALTHKKFVIK